MPKFRENIKKMTKKKFLSKLKEYVPGKSIEEVAREFGLNPKKIIKMASNENPFGPSEKVKEAIKKNVNNINVYSNPVEMKELKRIISNYVNCPTRNIVVDAGIDGVLDVLCKILINDGDETIISTPTFSMYKLITIINGGNPKFIKLNKDFNMSVDSLISLINKKTKVIFLCSPNNPTGNLIKNEDIEKILKKTNAFVFVDEAYGEFSSDSAIRLFKKRKYQNLIILRTFSKAFALAGLRIGYGILPENLVPDFEKTRLPFSVNNLALKAALSAIKDREYLKKTIKSIKKGRDYLRKNIKFKNYPSQANFILADVSPYKAENIVLKLIKKGIIIRNCSSFGKGMDSFVRITVGTDTQNKKLVRVINGFYDS